MSKIISRSYSKEGLDNWDKIFGKKKSKVVPLTVDDSKVKPLTIDDSHIIQSACEECYRLDGTHDQDCRNYL